MLSALSRHIPLSRSPLAGSSRAASTTFRAQVASVDGRRAFSNSQPRAAEPKEDDLLDEDAEDIEEVGFSGGLDSKRTVRRDPSYQQWLGTQGAKWRTANNPRDWMGSSGAVSLLNFQSQRLSLAFLSHFP